MQDDLQRRRLYRCMVAPSGQPMQRQHIFQFGYIIYVNNCCFRPTGSNLVGLRQLLSETGCTHLAARKPAVLDGDQVLYMSPFSKIHTKLSLVAEKSVDIRTFHVHFGPSSFCI